MEADVATVRDAWDRVSDAWDELAEELAAGSAPVRAAVLDAIAAGPGDRVLDLAGGTGTLGRDLAPLVGEVVCTDIAPGMVAAAERRAVAAGLTNVSCRVEDAHELTFDDASFDAVTCQFGLMLLPRPDDALREIRRVLRAGGRFAAATWGPPERNVRLLVIGAALIEHGHLAPRDPRARGGVFSLSDAEALATRVGDAGFQAVDVRPVAVERTYTRFEDFWDRNLATGAPLRAIVDALSPAELEAARETCRDACEHLRTPAGYRFPGEALVVSARR